MLAFAGCNSPSPSGSARLVLDGDLSARGGQLWLDGRINFEPSNEIRTALQSGVDVALRVEIRQRNALGPISWTRVTQTHPVRIGYLPLTEQWWLERSGQRRLFARLWLLLDALAQPEAYATGLTAETDPATIRARVRLDRSALPPPMHLPALLSPAWRLASPTWQAQPTAS